MIQSITESRWGLKGFTIAMGALAAAVALAVYVNDAQARDVSTCPDGRGCIWEGEGFEGGRVVYDQQPDDRWIYTAQRTESAKNRFNNRKFVSGYFGPGCGADDICSWTCLNPGQNVENFSRSDIRLVKIGRAGSRC